MLQFRNAVDFTSYLYITGLQRQTNCSSYNDVAWVNNYDYLYVTEKGRVN